MKKLKINTRLLRRVQKHILAEPQRYDQDKVLIVPEDYYYNPIRKPACGTVGCIAGWATLLADGKKEISETPSPFQISRTYEHARKLLGLDEEQFQRLCGFSADWPFEFRQEYIDDPQSQNDLVHNAQLASKRIDKFIESKGQL